MKNLQEILAKLTILIRQRDNTSTGEPPKCAWIRADRRRQDGAICSKNRKIVPYHGCARILRLTVSIPDYGSWTKQIITYNFYRRKELNYEEDGLIAFSRIIDRPLDDDDREETPTIATTTTIDSNSKVRNNVRFIVATEFKKLLVLFA